MTMSKRELVELKELIDSVFVRLELLEKVIAGAKCSHNDPWKYNVMDLIEQIYDLLGSIKKKADSIENSLS